MGATRWLIFLPPYGGGLAGSFEYVGFGEDARCPQGQIYPEPRLSDAFKLLAIMNHLTFVQSNAYSDSFWKGSITSTKMISSIGAACEFMFT